MHCYKRMGNNLSHAGINSKPVTIAVVTGCLLSSSFAGLAWLFYDRLNRATRLDNLKEKFYNLEQLNSAIDALRQDIEELKAIKRTKSKASWEDDEELISKKSSKTVRFKRPLSVVSSSETEYQSAFSGQEDDEFFDFDDEDDLEIKKEVFQTEEEALQLFEKVDVLLEGTSADHEMALQLLSNSEKEYGNNVEFLWRITKSCRMAAQASSNENKKKELTYKAIEYAKRGLAADDSNAEANKWFAIALGSLGDYVGVAEKIRNGVLFKQHIDKAISINHEDPLLHHLLGRFTYEVSMLSWIERKVATTLFSEMPGGSIEEALKHFEKAEDFRKKAWKENRLFLARCCIQLGQYSKAIYWIDLAIPIEVLTNEEQVMQDELKELQRKYIGYRRS